MKLKQLIGLSKIVGTKGDTTSSQHIIGQMKKREIGPLMAWINERKSKYYKIGWSYLYNHHDIEDVFQNTIIKVYENIFQLREEKYFETWVTSIFINQCKSLLRRKRRESVVENVETVEVGVFHEDFPNLEFKETLDQLEEIHREVIVLKYMIGYSQEEIAEIFNIPIGTVKSRIYRGLKLLREHINREVL